MFPVDFRRPKHESVESPDEVAHIETVSFPD